MNRVDTLYVDLDGTLLDISERFWRLHLDLVCDLRCYSIHREVYWAHKRQNAPLTAILPGCSPQLIDEYRMLFERRIEWPHYLRHDRLQPGATSALERLARDHRLVLVTMRRDGAALGDQLVALGLNRSFARVICLGHQGARNGEKHHGKSALVQRDTGASTSAIVIGDTEADVEAAQQLGMPSIAIAGGLRDPAVLASLGPTYIVDTIADVPALLEVAAHRSR